MKSGSAAYWLPATVSSIDEQKHAYTGYNSTSVFELDAFLNRGLGYFMDIYGTVVDAYYVTQEVVQDKDGNYDFHNRIVVTSLIDGEAEFEDATHEHWPMDLAEQMKEAGNSVTSNKLVKYDLNPVEDGPIWSRLNS